MQKKSLFWFFFLQKLYKKAFLKSQKYAHKHTCSHTYIRIKEILSAMKLGKHGEKLAREDKS